MKGLQEKRRTKTERLKRLLRKLRYIHKPFVIELLVYLFMFGVIVVAKCFARLCLKDYEAEETISAIARIALVGALGLFVFHVLMAVCNGYYMRLRTAHRRMLLSMVEMDYQIWNRQSRGRRAKDKKESER
jgi:ABC-type lipoprotein release transport system permease subunit